MKVPYFSKEQVEYLNGLFPERCPASSQEERDIWRYVGARELVRHINQAFQQQLEREMLVSKAKSEKK